MHCKYISLFMQSMVCETLPYCCSVWASVSMMVRLDCSMGVEGLCCTTLIALGCSRLSWKKENHRMFSPV